MCVDRRRLAHAICIRRCHASEQECAVSCEGRELWAALDGALVGLAKVTFVLCDVDDTELGGCKMGLREFVKERMPGVEGRGVVCFRSEKEEYPDCP